MKAMLFKIKALTNMHVGNGEVNYSIIDNEVERDAVTKYPTINATGVKGALREHFKEVLDIGDDVIEQIFGSEKTGAVPGKIKFLSANMMAIPMRTSAGSMPYCMVTTSVAVDSYNNLAQNLLCGEKINVELTGEKIEIEGTLCDTTKSLEAFGIECAAVMDSENFGEPALPVIARNKLENGKSANLWFEEIVPHESVFYFYTIVNDVDKELLEILRSNIEKLPIQFGGNASVGYGLCKVECMKEAQA